MKLFLLLIPFLAFQLNTQAQDFDPKLRAYFEWVDKAELAIIDSQFEAASEYYQTAFDLGYYFPIDLNNALGVSYFNNDIELGRRYAHQLSALGVRKTRMYRLIFSKDYESNNVFFETITESSDSIYNVSDNSEMHALASRMLKFFEKDQECRKRDLEGYELYICDSLLWIDIMSFIDSFGFPSFKKTGLFETYSKGHPGQFIFIESILSHSKGIDPNDTIFKIAFEAVKRGELHPKTYINCSDYLTDTCFLFLHRDKLTRQEVNEIDKRRAAMLLEPLEHYVRKLEYHKINGFYKTPFIFVPLEIVAFMNRRAEFEIIDE